MAFTIDDPSAIVDGKTIAQWTQDWTTWGLQAPVNTNPLTDPNGGFAHVDNTGSVFFIAGNFNGVPTSPVDRTFTVPAGKPLLIPMISAFDTEGPGIPATIPGWDKSFQEEVNRVMNDWQHSVTSRFASIDGHPVSNTQSYLERTGFFSMGQVQPGSLIESLGVAAGTDLPTTKSAGYWLMVEGLTPGTHTLDFGGSTGPNFVNGETSFAVHVIDHINVV
jgi:hypothetical protein